MQNRLILYRVLASILAFVFAMVVLESLGATGYWSLAGAVFCGLIAGQVVQRWWDRQRR